MESSSTKRRWQVVWTAKPFDNEKEACTYAGRVAEEGRNVSDRGEVLKMVVEVEE